MTCEEHHLLLDYLNDFIALLRANGATEKHIVYLGDLIKSREPSGNDPDSSFDETKLLNS